MKNKSKRLLSTLLAVVMVFCLFAALPLAASAADGLFQITEQPTGAVYKLNEEAVPLQAIFEYDVQAGLGFLDDNSIGIVKWYWSYENSNVSRTNGYGESGGVLYDKKIKYTTNLTPPTDTAGVKYYYAVITYEESLSQIGYYATETREAVTNPARIEVIAPASAKQDVKVRKVDDKENPLAGAVITLESTGSSAQSYQAATGPDGTVSFSAAEGDYILYEKQAPAGYIASGDKIHIRVARDGVFIYTPGTDFKQPYKEVTFVNKKGNAPDAGKYVITLKINDRYMDVNGVKQEIDPGRDTVPMIVNNRTILPIRAIVEAIGGTAGWDGATREITLAANGHTVKMWLDKTNIVVDGKDLTMDVALVSINDRTMVPVRFAAENLGCTVEWIGATKEVVITVNPYMNPQPEPPGIVQ